MLAPLIVSGLLATFAGNAIAQGVTCMSDGYTACPYTQATNAQVKALISEFCGDNGGWPYYMYQEALDQSFPYQGYYEVTSDYPGGFSQETCNSALNYIVSQCDATGQYWLTGSYKTGDVTFSVTPCEPI